ncbi:Uncharacterised protein [uncultured archaeon]|nr:Uncharacterised protein [uncultured archaeon]
MINRIYIQVVYIILLKECDRMKKERRVSKIIAAGISVLVLILLILSGPAQAYVINLVATNNNVFVGGIVKFNASVKVESHELIDIDYLILKLKSSNPVTEVDCKFYPNGTIISGCTGISIAQISSAPYGYGYNYGYSYGYGYGYKAGTLSYNITLDTTTYAPAIYKTSLSFIVGENTFENAGNNIVISKPLDHHGKGIKDNCNLVTGESIMDKNIRGKLGNVFVNGSIFDSKNDKFSLSIRSRGATLGEGYLTAQMKRQRLDFKFKVKSVDDNINKAYISVSGSYRLGLKKAVPLNTTIILDKETGMASFDSPNLSLSDMKVIFNGKDCSW